MSLFTNYIMTLMGVESLEGACEAPPRYPASTFEYLYGTLQAPVNSPIHDGITAPQS